MKNNPFTHTSITEKPENYEKCSVCNGQLPPGIPRVFRVEMPDGEPHRYIFRHVECRDQFAGEEREPDRQPRREAGSHLIDMAGVVFGMLTVIQPAGNVPGQTGMRWLCRCSCGKEVVINGGSLRQGKTRSCGHARTELMERTRAAKGLPTFARRLPALKREAVA